MVDTYPKIDVAGIDTALDNLARIEDELARSEAHRPRASLALIGMWAGLAAPFAATMTLAVCDALSAAVLGFGGNQGVIEAAQVTAGQQLQAIQWLFVGGEALALGCSLLALTLGIVAVRCVRKQGEVLGDERDGRDERDQRDERMAWGGMALGACELVGWIALAVWLLRTIGPLS